MSESVENETRFGESFKACARFGPDMSYRGSEDDFIFLEDETETQDHCD